MSIVELLSVLTNPDADATTRDDAQGELQAAKCSHEILSASEQVSALRAAAHGFPVSDQQAENLVELVAFNPHEDTIACVRSVFFELPSAAQAQALRLLARCFEVEGAETLVSLLRECQCRNLHVRFPSDMAPRHADIYFPALFDLLRAKLDWQLEAAQFIGSCARQEMLSPSLLGTAASCIRQWLQGILDTVKQLEQPSGIGWMWTDEYQQCRYGITTLLELCEAMPEMVTPELLAEGMQLRDPSLRHNFLIAHFVAGVPFDERQVEWIASHSESRIHLFHELTKLKRMDLFPAEFATNAALAESQMVNWLIFPTELGRAPDEIELMSIVAADRVGGSPQDDFYVFRFRTYEPHWSAETGWMCGVSGPFHRNVLDGETDSSSFSCFDPWESHSVDEHLGKILR
jgi:hypothetical protein